ncbi:hypothetical protein CB0940_01806 [Cercospora beticola]|uniref:Nuclear GTPase SLIP-GC n=1 Tax=Cercospora beticola TaxID=122368 RepID=A0A2G5I6F6_CERBT|nr:hypothetical protein CB0940_01806 [Cercospora beticola]PIB00380.1 hypothetical protein CB0940_01806 [Cercospora beticola]WPA97257.1 hypothetical protein RHO25_001866 [Cercospora beticola]
MAAPRTAQIRALALKHQPDEFHQLLQEDGRFWIAAVLDIEEESFLFLKAQQRTKLQKVHNAIHARFPENNNIVLKVGDKMVPPNGVVGDLPPPKEGILVIHAVKAEAMDPESEPFAASERPSTDVRSSQASAPPRPPLHPLDRNLSMTPKASPPVKPERQDWPGVTGRMPPSLPVASPVPSASPAPQISSESSATPLSNGVRDEHSTTATAADPTPDAAADEIEPEYKPREQENLFVDSQDAGPAQVPERGRFLAQLAMEETPERLEAGVQAGLKVLSELEVPLKELGPNEDAQAWLTHIARVRKEAVQNRTVVGVVGNTGAGKSSVINAMLDEERLVPTNCMRACTAVVTELSYNHSTDERAKYRAEIEFIKPEEWQKELNVLFQEAFDESGKVSAEVSNQDSEAGVAYAKIRAVYFKKTREMLARSSIKSLMADKKVQSVLGTTRKIVSPDVKSFYEKLQQVIDSKEKGQEKRDKNGNITHNVKREFEHWPLIKVVKIYVKSPALSTGAVIVDLPGVHDSNAARAAVAEGYMKQCTGLWIVAPITRAVDDKAAKSLLGDTFKRQLKFDGTYSAVTFICSKTDDISRTEAIDSLQLGDRMVELDDQLSDVVIRQRQLRKEKRQLDDDAEDQDAVREELDDALETWEQLLEQADAGTTVYAPDQSKKRKSTSASPQARKRRRRTVDSDDEGETETLGELLSTLEQDDTNDTGSMREPLTTSAIERKIEELKQLRKEARRAKTAAKLQKDEIANELTELDEKAARLEADKSAICIAGRNDYSRGAIQQDFAQGIRELDMENAEEENPDDFNPDEDLRDYDEVARTLPVFCVSSRAYQKLSGRMKKDSPVPGFTHIDQTEVPQLQAHCKKLTVKGRQANCRRFLNSMKQLLLSLALWSSDDGTGVKLTTQQQSVEKQYLSRKLKDLEKHLEGVVEDTLKDAVETLHEQLFAKLDPAVQSAITEAEPKAQSWGLPKSAGGLHWGTYRATVRRSGVFSGSAGPRDFNADLTEPIYRQLATTWEKVFQRRLPTILQTFKRQATNVVKQFHGVMEARTRERGSGAARLQMLTQQLDQYSITFGDLCSTAVTSLNEGQREINREFVPAILAAMEPAYNAAAEERGTGSFMRMKGQVTGHIQANKQQMFQSASQQVRQSLLKLCKTIRESMLQKADEIYLHMHRDYTSVMNGVNVGDIKLSREERVARREVDQVLTATDKHFREALDGELETQFDTENDQSNTNKDAADDFMDFDDFDDVESDEEEEDEEGRGHDSEAALSGSEQIGGAEEMSNASALSEQHDDDGTFGGDV